MKQRLPAPIPVDLSVGQAAYRQGVVCLSLPSRPTARLGLPPRSVALQLAARTQVLTVRRRPRTMLRLPRRPGRLLTVRPRSVALRLADRPDCEA